MQTKNLNQQKILFILNTLPHFSTAGGILYNQMIESCGKNSRVVGVSYRTKNKINHSEKGENRQFILQFPSNNLFWKILKKIPLLEVFYILIRFFLLKRNILDYVKRMNPDLIVVQLRGDALLVTNEILKSAKFPVVGMIEDTVEREIDSHYLLYRIKKKMYYNAIPKMKKIGVAGETMKNYIVSNFAVQTEILRPWFEKKNQILDSTKPNEINIFFAGNIYAKEEFKNFLKTLDKFSSDNSTLKITFFVATAKHLKYKAINFNLVQIGWVASETLQEYMRKSHFAYLPYIFDSKYRHSMQYAFPGKAGLYITNDLPILFHGPSYSSFNSFLFKYKVGFSCGSNNIDDIYESLSSMVFSDFQDFQYELEKSYAQEYTKESFDKKIKNFITT